MGGVKNLEVMRGLRKLKKEVAKEYRIDKMLLFGSRAKGEELLTSDVDILVVSRDFSELPFRKRPDVFLDRWKLPVDLEVLCYAPDEFKRKLKEIGIVRDAVKTAVSI